MKTATKLLCFLIPFLAIAMPAPLLAQGGNLGGKTVDGITIYLGMTPAAAIAKEYPKESAERMMHGGVPVGGDWHHILVAIFDAKTGRRVTGAHVTATVGEVGRSGVTEELQQMTLAGQAAYGNYFRMPGGALYRIDLSIRRPGVPGTVKAQFVYEHTHAELPHHGKVVDGVVVSVNLVPAAFFSAFPPGSPQARMHGGVPSGAEFDHLMVTLFNASTGKRITDAQVTATVRRSGESGSGLTKTLQAMSWGGYTNYGNYFPMPEGINYVIDVAVRRPGVHGVVEAQFRFWEILR